MNASVNAGIPAMAQQARELARVGRAAEAALVWQRVLGADPNHTEALLALATQALARRDATLALQMLQHAAATAPRDPMVQIYQAVAFRDLGNPQEEMAAVTRALAIDPYFFPALLHKATLLERLGKRRQAARVYKDVLKIMPAKDQAAPAFARAVEHAQAVVDENRGSLERHLDGVLADLRRRHSTARLDRFEETVAVMTGAKKRYSPEPVMLYFAQLPPLQFYPNELFPWIPELEAATEDIRRECEAVVAEQRDEFDPYIQRPPGAPLDQWKDLNHSPRWATYLLWQHGQRIDAHCERCPRTAEVVESLPLARTPNFSPNVLFSALEAHTTIPPHNGDTNVRLIVHLPLILPPGCTFRVGNDTREWQYGKAWVFDDSVDHEARNDSDQLRVQLMLDVWNPFLTDVEKELVNGLLNGQRTYYAAED
ncbi:MAG TPA: aspartyl/asparaginyl beta-hydroxylase domain-containing protein [Steroidobacteraceae bacterium]|nr:aspartyl/asparaginyl beta-hydroxylase domain-containing protein [Steroidobacteraceae bacterium]